MEKIKWKWNTPIFAAALLFLFLSAAFLLISRRIADFAVESNFQALRQSTQQVAGQINYTAKTDQKLLESVAQILAAQEQLDGEGTTKILGSFGGGNMISRLEILFPDNRLLMSDGQLFDASGTLSFAEQAAGGAHISGREKEANGSGRWILRSYVPVIKEGKTQALLCGIIDLEKLENAYAAHMVTENARLCLIAGQSGDFLVDTLHGELENTDKFGDRRIKSGYRVEQVSADLANGKAGRVISFSRTAGEYLYCEYGSVGVNDWMLMLSLPESAVLANANRIRTLLWVLAGLEAVILAAYFFWLLMQARRMANEKEGQLNRVQFLHQIERTLFDAHRNPSLVEEALHKIADALHAESAFFITFKDVAVRRLFIWNVQGKTPTETVLSNHSPYLMDLLRRRNSFLSYGLETLRQSEPEEYQLLRDLQVQSLMLTPVESMDHLLIGVLGAVNMKRRWQTAELLESTMLSFSMTLSNMESFQTMKKMGMIDQLTGMQNRNSYQRALECYEKSGDESLACVYVDADGLHEINNNWGHVSGDRMLQTVAEALKSQFGADNAYRVGGDEFVAFCQGIEEAEVDRRIRRMVQGIQKSNYHISVGVEWRKNKPLVFEMVKQAEEKMYECKRAFYKEKGGGQQAVREMNRQLEETLLEKRDLDVFRSVIASKYMGVYIINLSVDTMRSIYIPPYFEKSMQEANGKFSLAMKTYIQEMVSPTYQQAFMRMLNYEWIESKLHREEEPELYFRKRDGSGVLLRIYRSPDYSDQRKESIWSFETVS